MALLLGPCMLLAPMVLVLAILAIPLWPVALAAVGICWLIVWPLERLCGALGLRTFHGASVKIGRLFRTLLTPWTYFDTPSQPKAGR